MLYAFEDRVPRLIGNNHYISECATIIGSVVIENNVCILPGVVIRADNDLIHIGEGSNIQDGAILHTDPGIPMHIGKSVTIAHRAVLHGCNIGENSVIAMSAVVMNNAVIGKNCIVGSQALILENQNIPDGSLVVGSPGKIKKLLTEEEIKKLKWYSQHYVEKIARFKNGMKLINHE
jgi:carbonic anhydrase/acetyltransferase-like protein (isoleucine patch superfamily)